jgi:hypothetical protein
LSIFEPNEELGAQANNQANLSKAWQHMMNAGISALIYELLFEYYRKIQIDLDSWGDKWRSMTMGEVHSDSSC